jgi:putative transposase
MQPKTYRYETRRADDAVLRARLKELAAERRRFGYRRLKLLLDREGCRVNHKKVCRIYPEERLAVRKRSGRKRALGTRAPAALPRSANQRWSLDFVADALSEGRRFRVLCIVDDFTRECLALVADTSLSGRRVARELDRLIAERGKPKLVVSDNVLRHGTHLDRDPALERGERRLLALHPARQADPKCVRRELQRPVICATVVIGRDPTPHQTPAGRGRELHCTRSISLRRRAPRQP